MKIADKNTSAVRLVNEALEKAEKLKEYNCFISLNRENALAQASEIDRRIRNNEEVGVLAGVPYALKDNFLSPEGCTTAGSKMLAEFQAPVTATAVKKLEEAGAIMIGRSNLDAFAHGSSTENSYFGPSLNSHDKTRVAGGSSGGSAVAVALGIVAFALGTDTGGSIRQPAAYNGVVGIKPSYGTVSRYGVVAMASSTDTIGCLANSAEDADLVMSIIAGKDEKDSTSLENFWQIEPKQTKLKIGLISDFMQEGVDKEILTNVEQSLKKLREFGHLVNSIEIPVLNYGLASYYILQSAEVASNLSRFDGVRYGHQADNPRNVEDLYVKSRNEGFMDENKRRIMIGNFVLSSGFYDAYFLKAQKARSLIIQAYVEKFKEYDVLICPVTPSVAFRLGEKINDPIQMYLEDVMSVGPSLAGLPAISVPVGNTAKEGLPVAVQLIGPYQSDRTLLKLAREIM